MRVSGRVLKFYTEESRAQSKRTKPAMYILAFTRQERVSRFFISAARQFKKIRNYYMTKGINMTSVHVKRFPKRLLEQKTFRVR